MEQIAQVGKISDIEKDRATASLIGMEFTSTTFDSASLLQAEEMSDATAWRNSLKRFVEIFRSPNGDLQTLLGIFVDFPRKLYRASHLPESRSKIVTALLDALWNSISLRLPLLHIRRMSAELFILNPVGQRQFEQCFASLYKAVADRIIIP